MRRPEGVYTWQHLEYYEGYFDDAGPENEGEVLRELGNPFGLLHLIYCGMMLQLLCWTLRETSCGIMEKQWKRMGIRSNVWM